MITGRLLGLEYGIEVPGEVEAYTRHVLTDSIGPVAKPTTFRLRADGDEWVIDVEAEERLRTIVPSYALAHFFWELHQSAVRSISTPIVHAAALRSPAGRGVLIVGPSGAGKTTATISLLRAGYQYVTDDAVVLEGGSTVRGMAKSLGLRAGARALLGLSEHSLVRPPEPFVDDEAIQVPASCFGPTIAVAQIHRIVVLDPDADPSEPAEISGAVAAVELLQQGFQPPVLNPDQFDAVVGLAKSASSVRTGRLPVDALPVVISSLLDRL